MPFAQGRRNIRKEPAVVRKRCRALRARANGGRLGQKPGCLASSSAEPGNLAESACSDQDQLAVET